jgi:hypothetical protein
MSAAGLLVHDGRFKSGFGCLAVFHLIELRFKSPYFIDIAVAGGLAALQRLAGLEAGDHTAGCRKQDSAEEKNQEDDAVGDRRQSDIEQKQVEAKALFGQIEGLILDE